MQICTGNTEHTLDQTIHIGSVIKKIKQDTGKKDRDIATVLNITRSSVQDIYKRSYIRTDDLEKLSKLFNYNFFQHYLGNGYQPVFDEPTRAEAPDLIYKKPEYVRKVTVLVELDGTVERYKEECRLLRNINEAVKKKI